MSYRIPRTLDAPIRTAGIPIDTTIVTFLVLILLKLIFEVGGIVGFASGIFCGFVYSKVKTRSLPRRFIRWCYWYLPIYGISGATGIRSHMRKLKSRYNDEDKDSCE